LPGRERNARHGERSDYRGFELHGVILSRNAPDNIIRALLAAYPAATTSSIKRASSVTKL
jgi:hypothetical protein